MKQRTDDIGRRSFPGRGVPYTLVLASALAALGCGGSEDDRTVLRVVSYPWIPDAGDDGFVRLTRFLEEDFESRFPDIDLQLRPVGDSFGVYELEADDGGPGKLVQWLTNEPVSSATHGDTDGYHLVEVDTLLLGDIHERQLIAEWADIDTGDWHDAGRDAVTIDGQILGVPRLLCGHFIMSRDPSLTSAATVDELIAGLDALGADKQKLSGNFLGSWNSAALYVDAWVDTYPQAPIAEVFAEQSGMIALDEGVMQDLEDLGETCSFSGENWCMDGTYYNDPDPNRAASELGRGEVHATFGYSERLHYIVKEGQQAGVPVDDITIASMPMGMGSRPVLFADAFVMRKGCDGACQEAALAFVHYMNDAETQEAIMLSRDSGEDLVPRYLLPATKSALTDTELASDPFYIAIREQIEGGKAYPNQGFYTSKDPVRCELLRFWGVGECE